MIKAKTTKSLALGLVASGLLAWPGCEKAQPPPPPGTMQMFGINVEVPRLEREFQNASPELQTVAQEIKKECRTLQLVKMRAALENLGREPSLTESQKKAVSDIFGQVDRVLAKKAALSGGQ
jgi:hypothetical protein